MLGELPCCLNYLGDFGRPSYCMGQEQESSGLPVAGTSCVPGTQPGKSCRVPRLCL